MTITKNSIRLIVLIVLFNMFLPKNIFSFDGHEVDNGGSIRNKRSLNESVTTFLTRDELEDLFSENTKVLKKKYLIPLVKNTDADSERDHAIYRPNFKLFTVQK